ncbi:MAG: YhbY family RNA-binding protein [Clostridiales bacterium]|nr:YhbY family RNA-binding protein [Clostridiales bacterium]
MTSKERAQLKAQANGLEPLFQVGKSGMSDALANQTLDAFRTKELIKIKVLLDTAPEGPKEIAQKLAEATGSEVVQVIGGVIILFKENPELNKPKKPAEKKKSKPLSKVKAKRAKELKAAAEKQSGFKKDYKLGGSFRSQTGGKKPANTSKNRFSK